MFGQTLSRRGWSTSVDLITGALPAQYGLRTAGIIDITTKSGFRQRRRGLALRRQPRRPIEPSFEYGGSTRRRPTSSSRATSCATSSASRASTARSDADHDRTDQGQGFAYLDHILDDDRPGVASSAATPTSTSRSPTRPGCSPTAGLQRQRPDRLSQRALNESQRETTGFAIGQLAARRRHAAPLQTSLFAPLFDPDLPPGRDRRAAVQRHRPGRRQAATPPSALQAEGVYNLNDAHTLRAGVIIQADRATSETTSQVFPVDADGDQTGDVPIAIVDNGGQDQFDLQRLSAGRVEARCRNLTLNYGLRFDQFDGYRDENQLSPRVNLVWTPLDGTTVHAGYARYFTPPPFELVGDADASAKFVGTTAAPAGDAGHHALRRARRTISTSACSRSCRRRPDARASTATTADRTNLIDEGQFGAPIILTPFNYRDGLHPRASSSAPTTPTARCSAYANFAYAKAQGKDIDLQPVQLRSRRPGLYRRTTTSTSTTTRPTRPRPGVAYRFRDGCATARSSAPT